MLPLCAVELPELSGSLLGGSERGSCVSARKAGRQSGVLARCKVGRERLRTPLPYVPSVWGK